MAFTARVCAVLALAATLIAACSSKNGSVVRPPESSASSQSGTAASTPASSASSSATVPTSASRAVHPAATVTPHTGLHDGDTVTVSASGFTGGQSFIVVECADKGQQTGPGDCNLAESVTVNTNASGSITTHLVVRRGPFGSNAIVCNAGQRCLVSVTQATLSPTEEADVPISFG